MKTPDQKLAEAFKKVGERDVRNAALAYACQVYSTTGAQFVDVLNAAEAFVAYIAGPADEAAPTSPAH